ncbi:MAG: rhomboid family intrarane serine protease [Nevskia sp.]|nr:rhomboid family intrarane serine protease [Nevskia sp.]
MTPITYALLIANLIAYGIEAAVGGNLVEQFALWPLGAGFQIWQLVTSAFLHANLTQLATNMFGLWMFGRAVEQALGSARFLQLYCASVLTASLAQLLVCALLGQVQPTLGASGGLFGVLAAFALLFPKQTIVLLFPPIPLPARVFVLLYAAFELFSGVAGTQSGVAHFAHLGGLVGGYTMLLLWRRRAAPMHRS